MTIAMLAPAGFTGTISCTGGTPPLSGTTYTPDVDGLIAADPADIAALMRAGFTVSPATGTPDIPMANTALTTAGAGTLTAAALISQAVTRTGPVAAFTDTTATAALIIAALVNPVVGTSWEFVYKNTTAFAATLAGGSGVTLSGQTIVPPNSVGRFLVTMNGATTCTMLGLSVGPMTTSALLASTALTTVGAGTITAAGIAGGVTARSGSTAAFADTTATAGQIIAARPNANVGESWLYLYQNNTKADATLAGGTGVTVSGITVVPRNTFALYLATYTAAATVTMVGLASGLVSQPKTQAAVATADSGASQTLTAAMVTGANEVFHRTTGGSTPSLTLPLGSAMDAALPDMEIGQSYKLRVINTNSGDTTIVTNTGWTLTGTLTLATNTWRDFVVTKTDVATYTGVAVGTGTES